MGTKRLSTATERRAALGRWRARGAVLNYRKYVTPTSIPAEVLSRLASMGLPPDPQAYNDTLQRLLREHEEGCCND